MDKGDNENKAETPLIEEPITNDVPTTNEVPVANEVPITNEFIDKMTLELLMNKNHYNRYTSQTNPKRFAEIEEYRENVRAYREPILEMTKDLLANPQKQINTDVNETFEHYTKSLIRYFKIKELENRSHFGRSNGYGCEDDDDVLFDKIEDRPFIQNATQEAFYTAEGLKPHPLGVLVPNYQWDCPLNSSMVYKDPMRTFWSKDQVIKR